MTITIGLFPFLLLLVAGGFGMGFSVCYQRSKKYRNITLCADAPCIQQIQKTAFDKSADLWLSVNPYLDPEEQARASIKFKDGAETREIEFHTPTCEQAAKLVMERLAK